MTLKKTRNSMAKPIGRGSVAESLKQICQDLLDQGILPPYTLVIKDGYEDEIHLDVTLESLKPSDAKPCDGPFEVDVEFNYDH